MGKAKTLTPGEAIEAELQRRAWTHDDLARVLGRHRPMVTSLISGRRSVTPEVAVVLAAALGNTAEYWMALEAARQLTLIPEVAESVAKRAKLLGVAPLRAIQQRGWISQTDDEDQLERELCSFYGIPSLESEPPVTFAAKKANPTLPIDRDQIAWCARARQLASAVAANRYSPECQQKLTAKLRRLAAYPKEAAFACEVLREYGIRLVVVEPFDKSRIDGAAFWLSPDQPAIAVSLRLDRIDNFWFTLMHECAHVFHGDAASVDTNLSDKDRAPDESRVEIERRADEAASAVLVDQVSFSDFIKAAVLFSKARIVQFAHSVKIHPGIVVGQIHHRLRNWDSYRQYLVPVREYVTSTTLTDGWGQTIPAGVLD